MFNQKWKNYKFDDLFEFEGSYSVPREELGDEGFLYLHYGDMHTSSRNFVDVDKDSETLPKYKINGSPKFLLNDGDLVFVDASEDYPGTCKTFLVKNKTNKPFVAGLHTFIARSKVNVISNEFKKYLTEMPEVKKQIYKYVQGYKVYGINRENLKKINVNLPDYDESVKIAKILDCWARAVELQENKIKKLEEKKKALMQKLLKPKDDWKSFKLGNVCKIKTGKLDANQMANNGKYPFFTCSKEIYAINNYAFDCEALLMAGNGEIGDIKYYNGKFNAYQRTYVLSDFKFNIKYVMFYLLHNFDKSVCKGVQKSSMPYIKLELLNNAIIYYPQNYDKIANLFDTIELKLQKQKDLLNNYKLQQKALMQKLLTGKVRVNG